MQPCSQKNSGFTLIEVLVATAVTAMLMSAITLNLSVRDGLVRASTNSQPRTALQARIDEILLQKSITEIESYVGTLAINSDLTDPSSTPNRKFVTVTQESAGSGAHVINVLAIEVSTGDNSVSRWLAPTN